MDQKTIYTHIAKSLQDFSLPRWQEIPDVGLYLKQTGKYLAEMLQPLEGVTISASMISNYVKHRLISSPVKKMYSREQIAALAFIAVAKTVLPLENIRLLMEMYREILEPEQAWTFFCRELEEMLQSVCTAEGAVVSGGRAPQDETRPGGLPENRMQPGLAGTDMLRSTIIAIAYKVCLDKAFTAVQKEQGRQEHDRQAERR